MTTNPLVTPQTDDKDSCEPGTGWMHCAHKPGLTVCRCACTCLDQRHCGKAH